MKTTQCCLEGELIATEYYFKKCSHFIFLPTEYPGIAIGQGNVFQL